MTRRKLRIGLAEFVGRLPSGAVEAMWAEAAATLGEIPCLRHYAVKPCDDPPEPHQTCGHCFCWRDCTNPECDHPACGHGPETRFRQVFGDAFPDLLYADVFINRDEPKPLATNGRMPILVEEVEPDERAGRAVLEALSRHRDGWLNLYDVRGVAAEKHLNAEVWLVREGIKVEVAHTRYSTGCWVALDVARGVDTFERMKGGVGGGHEFRLTSDEAGQLTLRL